MATAHFSNSELACKHCGELPPQEFQDRLEAFRVLYGKPMKINSGFRCATYNQRVSSTGPSGPHTKGAVDVACGSDEAYQIIALAISRSPDGERWFNGIGVSQSGQARFVHLDTCHFPPRVWSY